MSTTINKTDGTVLVSIPDGAIDTAATDLTLIGKLYRNYGEVVNENFVKLVENFANSSTPPEAITGQLWYDTQNKNIKVYRSTGFVPLSVLTSSSSEPSSPILGDFWWDTVESQLKFYNSTAWTVISPGYTTTQGISGAIVETIQDTLSASHVVTKIYQSGTVVAIVSNDDDFFPSDSIVGFTSVKKGITLSSSSDIKLHGTATEAEQLVGGLVGTQFIRNDIDSTANGTITLDNSSPLILGPAGDLEVTVSGSTVNIVKATAGDVDIRNSNNAVVARFSQSQQILTDDGSASVPTYSFTSDTDTGVYLNSVGVMGFSAAGNTNLKVSANGIALDASTTSKNIAPAANNTYDIGTSSAKYSTIYADTLNGTAVEALYADLAEKYSTGEELAPGTVVTVCAHEDHEVEAASVGTIAIGVVSTDPALMMNSEAEGQYIGLKGRLPVRIVGAVKKGQAVYVDANGCASTEINGGSLVGVALESNSDEGEKLVECVLKV